MCMNSIITIQRLFKFFLICKPLRNVSYTKETGQIPRESQLLHSRVLQALFDLEATNTELKSDLRDLYITGAKEVDVNASRKAIIIHVSNLSPTASSVE